jgi:hypothetical protein
MVLQRLSSSGRVRRRRRGGRPWVAAVLVFAFMAGTVQAAAGSPSSGVVRKPAPGAVSPLLASRVAGEWQRFWSRLTGSDDLAPGLAAVTGDADLDKGVLLDGPGFRAPSRDELPVSFSTARTARRGVPQAELALLRTASSETWLNDDGVSYTTVVFSKPKYFKAADGSFQEIDNRVVADAKRPGWVTTVASGAPVSFGPLTPGATTGGVEVATGSGLLVMRPEPAGCLRQVRVGVGAWWLGRGWA